MSLSGTPSRILALMTGALIAAVMAPAPAHADLKIASEVSVTRSSPQSEDRKPDDTSPPSSRDSAARGSSLVSPHAAQEEHASHSPRKVTTYYQGSEARVEAADGTVTIYDLGAGKVYTLLPADRTYGTASLKSLLEQRGNAALVA